MSDEELKITRRLFLQHTAVVTAMTAGLHSIAMKTDALAQQTPVTESLGGDQVSSYPYQ